MKLSSVRSLKAELFSVPTAVTADLAESTPFAVFSSRRATARRTMDGIALGVARVKKQQYRLAVRLQRTGPLISAMTDEISRLAKGEVDVQQIGTLVKFQGPTSAAFYRRRRRPLRIGSSIGDVPLPGFIAAGTLGCFVVRRTAPLFIGMLTNNHVIANENANAIGSPVAQPGTLDGGEFPDDQVGELGKVIKLRKSATNFVDAAVGDVFDDVEFDTRTIGNLGSLEGQVSVLDLPDKATVHKVGRTTGQTKGRITAFDVDNVRVEYDMGVLRFDNQIEIEGTGKKAFSDSGDSGSLIVDDQLRAVGLLFAGGDEGGSNGKGLTYANPIDSVLDALKVDLEI
ncbi:MAG TPA: hypothetical protein VML55_05105 [Planctomycetaceae bacterium]|nr:hypothetical protein [Planctomycetaceae bacterium]